MRVTYDREADALALELREGRVSKDVKLAENVFAGYDRAGNLVEIQVLDVSKLEQPWISLEAAAKLLGKSTRTVLRWIEAGKISPPKVGRDYRFTAEMVQSLAGESEPEAPPARKRASSRRR
jgi:excisionase family DNA binding protein